MLPRLFRFNYAVARDGVYCVTPRPDSKIGFVDSEGASRHILPLDKLADLRLTLSPDERFACQRLGRIVPSRAFV